MKGKLGFKEGFNIILKNKNGETKQEYNKGKFPLGDSKEVREILERIKNAIKNERENNSPK